MGRTKELIAAMEDLVDGWDNDEVALATASLCSQAIADGSATLADAEAMAIEIGASMARSIKKNWSLVEARRRKQMQ